MCVEKYSPASNAWDVIAQMYDDRICFCACSFIDSIYVIGGFRYGYMNCCLEFNTKNKSWRKTASIKVAREDASCTVFEGRIVVSGGYTNNNVHLKTVEAYNHTDDSWTNMPSMIEVKILPKSIAIKNKLFVFGGWDKEVSNYSIRVVTSLFC